MSTGSSLGIGEVRRILRSNLWVLATGAATAGCALVVAALVVAAAQGPPPRDSGPVSSSPNEAGESATERVGRSGPIAFEPSACTSWPPTGAPNGRTVVVDAGHGGADPGATTILAGQGEISEATVTLGIARVTTATLRRAGYRVVVTRDGDEGVARPRTADLDGEVLTPAGVKRHLEARNLCANAGNADAQVSIHLNASADPSARGAETVYNARRAFAARNRRLATALQDAIVQELNASGWAAPDRGVVRDEDGGAQALTPEGAAYGQLLQLGPESPPWFRRPSHMPGAVIEPLFVTFPDDAERALDDEGQAVLARAITRGIEDYFA